MAVAVLRNPALRSESARRHAMLASTLAAMARALDWLHEPDLVSEPADPSGGLACRPSSSTTCSMWSAESEVCIGAE
jgi:hypothetical protein